MGVFKCQGYKYDCSARNQVVDANPDIAGVGVIVGFLATTCLAFLVTLSVLFLDRYNSFIALITKTHYAHDERGPYWRSPAFWSRVLSRNLLALADTQIMTGLAVQFTAILKHCELSIYHFQIVTELAFLTTVTHLLTLVTLRNYFVQNKWINLPRIFFMAGNLGLLGYTSYISYTYDLAGLDLSSRLACFYQGTRPEFERAFQTKWALLLVGAIGGHTAVILAMYVLPETPEGTAWTKAKRFGAGFRTWVLTPVYAIYGVYMAATMLSDTQALGNPSVRMNGTENEWGFGQFLPVLLLALPVFAGWESFWEEKDDKDKEVDRFGRKNVRASRSNAGLLDAEKGTAFGEHQFAADTWAGCTESNGKSKVRCCLGWREETEDAESI
ncbi:uncharacterized protein N0V89_011464 [Didymosphaeria variabile]|uniref:Uncharacterized protein n=1 Tax=Didymosphaeria variabile TaxID=1932322 RepID=A0A9W9C5R8_9PLEO|nr:uncharacterized protein N0V89_011464 [Didymosphaeria variabile]KAJ4345334.1 hypothetical protein N0V89_011464 [Didymosphaeria variabile]